MSAVIGGWVAGYAMSVVCTFVFTWLLVRAKGPNFVERLLGEGTPLGLAAVPISLGMMYGWTIFGLSLGILYDLLELDRTPDVLGSPSGPFLIGAAALSLMPLPFALLTWPRKWWLWLILSGSFLGLFGWAMPIMAAQ